MSDSALPITWHAADDTELTLRRIGGDDFALAREFLRSLSYGTRYFRFGRGDFVYPDDEIRRLLEPDPQYREHLIVIRRSPEATRMVGSARYVVQSDPTRCEFSIVVLDGCQGLGVGRRLMEGLIDSARARGIQTIACSVLGTNSRMLDFVQRLGFVLDEASAAKSIKRLERSIRDHGPDARSAHGR